MSYNALTGLDINYLNSQNKISNYSQKTRGGDDRNFGDLMSKESSETDQARANPNVSNDKKLREKCTEMESLLWKQVLNAMKKTIDKHKLLDGGQAEEIFSDFLYDEYAMMMAKNSGTGISDTMYKQLSGNYK